MAMSKDRIIFWPFGKNRKSPADTVGVLYRVTSKALRATCGLSEEECIGLAYTSGAVVTRPSQFARFVIARAKYGAPNQMHFISPILVGVFHGERAARLGKVLDVSRRVLGESLVGFGIYTMPECDEDSYGALRPADPAPIPLAVEPSLTLSSGERFELEVTGTVVRITRATTLRGDDLTAWTKLRPRKLEQA